MALVQFVLSEALKHQQQMYSWTWQVADGEDFSFRVFLTILLEGTKSFLSYWPLPWGSRQTPPEGAGVREGLTTGTDRIYQVFGDLCCCGFTATDTDVLKGEPADVFCAPYRSMQCLPVLEHYRLSDTRRGGHAVVAVETFFRGSLEDFLFPAVRNDPPLSPGYVGWLNDS